MAVPLATYTGWNLRRRDIGAGGMLMSLSGSYIPFPATEAARRAARDPRQSIEGRYGNFEGYRKRWLAARDELLRGKYLLKEDADRLETALEGLRPLFPGAK